MLELRSLVSGALMQKELKNFQFGSTARYFDRHYLSFVYALVEELVSSFLISDN